jgi:hypothetical protein
MEVAGDDSSKGVGGGEKRGHGNVDGNKQPKFAKVSLLTTCLLVYLFIPSFLHSFIFD